MYLLVEDNESMVYSRSVLRGKWGSGCDSDTGLSAGVICCTVIHNRWTYGIVCCGMWMQHLSDLCGETCWWMSMGFFIFHFYSHETDGKE